MGVLKGLEPAQLTFRDDISVSDCTWRNAVRGACVNIFIIPSGFAFSMVG